MRDVDALIHDANPVTDSGSFAVGNDDAAAAVAEFARRDAEDLVSTGPRAGATSAIAFGEVGPAGVGRRRTRVGLVAAAAIIVALCVGAGVLALRPGNENPPTDEPAVSSTTSTTTTTTAPRAPAPATDRSTTENSAGAGPGSRSGAERRAAETSDETRSGAPADSTADQGSGTREVAGAAPSEVTASTTATVLRIPELDYRVEARGDLDIVWGPVGYPDTIRGTQHSADGATVEFDLARGDMLAGWINGSIHITDPGRGWDFQATTIAVPLTEADASTGYIDGQFRFWKRITSAMGNYLLEWTTTRSD